MRRAERLFRLVGELRARPVSTAEQLAGLLEVSTRTIYRDIGHLQGSGLPIEGEAGVGYMLRPGFDLPPMTFTYEQFDALALGLNFVASSADAELAEAAREARAKLQATLGEEARRRFDGVPLYTIRRGGRAPAHAATVRRAIRGQRVLQLAYEDEEDRLSERRIRPLALYAFTDGWLIAAWCELRTGFRAFRLDRVRALALTDERFEAAPGQDLAAYLAERAGRAAPLP